MSYVVGSAEVELVPSAEGFQSKADAAIGDLKIGVLLDPDIAGLKAQLAEVSDMRLGVDLDDAEAKAELDVLDRDRTVNLKAKTDKSVTDAAPAFNGILAAVVGLGPALIPVAAGLSAVALGLGAVLGAGIGGVALFAGLALYADQTNKAFQQGLAPALASVKSALGGLVSANTGALLQPLADGAKLLAAILPSLTPIIQAASKALDGLIQGVDPSGFKSFASTIATLVGPAITDIGKIIGNVTSGLGQMMIAFAPIGKAILDEITKLTTGFAGIGQSAGFQTFIAYVKQNLPTVESLISGVVTAAGHIVEAVAPIGAAMLPVITGIVNGIAKIPLPILTGLGVAIGVIVGGMQLFAVLGPVIEAITTGWAVVTGVLNAVMDANPIALIIIAVAALIAGIILLVTHWTDVTNFLSTVWNATVTWLKGTLDDVGNWWNSLWSGVASFFTGIWNGIVSGVSKGVSDVVSFFVGLQVKVLDVLKGAGTWLLDVGENIVSGMWKGLQNAWNGLLSGFRSLVNLLPAWAKSILGIHSPSKVFEEIGGYVGQGFQLGIVSSMNDAMDAADNVLKARVADLNTTATATVSGAITTAATITTGDGTTAATDPVPDLLRQLLAKTPSAQDNANAMQLNTRMGTV